ncbi:response regulator [Herbaspirillum seropedicae]|uniref:Two component response regulator protein n=1 Tax=Herbaspirillum seropedicae (strain SmR1) TaxID=757424 RepID=D8IRA2_HERSS|nr:response regulator [Herbaspirillum seropedicae]ADJ65228.1 two component response regulator protein [Herbaspirillum seropedicae SmR1]AKN67081.1 transcriptional regulator [Herbaspirillum seropedicae]MDR6395508.1 CheY-like chemotaxis protein [Herbaspirillum seropedicae]NQE30318.1 transcriptional regulator [Herbaspirillum seropedicae]QDD66055.1 response regulator [Herbaspirillum seropedicae]
MSRSKQKTVLVVEDHPDSRDLLCEILAHKGLSVMAASDGVEAIALMQSQAPSLVLTDLRMPRMDGMELARYIKSDERFGHIPVALISANLPAANARVPEISAFLLKPCSVDHLLTTVTQLLR